MVKTLNGMHGCKIEFEKLDYGRTVSNVMRFYIDGNYNGAIYPTQKFGNWWYLFFYYNPDKIEQYYIDRLFLRWTIYCNDYDAYSDISKDIFGYRVRKTAEEFEQMYKDERAKYEHIYKPE